MTLYLHDTMSGEKRPFEPRPEGPITVYLCGPTVYDFAHIGNARPAVAFDVLYRVLARTFAHHRIVYARNITDVDDKINAKAAAEAVPIGVVTARYEAAYLEDMAQLNVLPPTLAPHVTEHLDAIRGQIDALVAAGSAYAAEGHVLFDVSSFGDYGRLSNRTVDDMIAGARVEVAPYKRNAADFVLWKPSKPGEPEWPSPWGPGRPGWHIECSAMIEAVLGLPVDIHCGGHDLIFPHHENEIAQGRCAHGDPVYARYWLHNGFLTMDAEKMSKSLGNVVKLHDLVGQVPGEVVRFALLSAHYRAPLDWTGELIDRARKSLDRLYQVLVDAERVAAGAGEPADRHAAHEGDAAGAVHAALLDDLNTPLAISALFGLADALRAEIMAVERGGAHAAGLLQARAELLHGAHLLGLLTSDPEAWFKAGADEDQTAHVDGLVAARGEARKAKDWAEADRLRAELSALNVEVMDGPQGATWRFRDKA